jgi:ATP-dependent RNA helicase DDX27
VLERDAPRGVIDDDDDVDDDESVDVDDEDAKREAAKAAKYFDSALLQQGNQGTSEFEKMDVFAQLNLSRPLLRGVASIGFVTPTPIQSRVIPLALSGRDVCAR